MPSRHLSSFRDPWIPPQRPALALTCVPGAGVALLSLAQPLLVPGVCKVNEQHQLDEDEEEGAHDAKVEPDWMGRGE